VDRAEADRVAETKLHGATVVGSSRNRDAEQALALKGSAVSVRRESLPIPAKDTTTSPTWWVSRSVNERGRTARGVKRLFTNGAQDVMELAGERTVAAVGRRGGEERRRRIGGSKSPGRRW